MLICVFHRDLGFADAAQTMQGVGLRERSAAGLLAEGCL
jgi:hypothetical protein